MLTVLSLMDDRSRPKGSRDPLGIEAIWSFMGRKVVGNLTTVTSNLDNFMVALLCCHHANTSSDQLDNVQTAFLRAEQLAAYLRLSGGDEGFLGITRAKANFKSSQLPLGQGEAAQILSNQLSYGLWGLYSTAMKVAGLIDGPDRRRLGILVAGAVDEVLELILASVALLSLRPQEMSFIDEKDIHRFVRGGVVDELGGLKNPFEPVGRAFVDTELLRDLFKNGQLFIVIHQQIGIQRKKLKGAIDGIVTLEKLIEQTADEDRFSCTRFTRDSHQVLLALLSQTLIDVIDNLALTAFLFICELMERGSLEQG